MVWGGAKSSGSPSTFCKNEILLGFLGAKRCNFLKDARSLYSNKVPTSNCVLSGIVGVFRSIHEAEAPANIEASVFLFIDII